MGLDFDFRMAHLEESCSRSLDGELFAGSLGQVEHRLPPVRAGGVLNRESALAESNELEPASPCTRDGDAPMPASGLLEDMQYRSS